MRSTEGKICDENHAMLTETQTFHIEPIRIGGQELRVGRSAGSGDHPPLLMFNGIGANIELLEPLGAGSPIAKFLEKAPDGGIHHVCYEVEDILSAREQLKAAGARVLGDGEPKIGAHGKPVLFFHPKDFSGALVEIEQVR